MLASIELMRFILFISIISLCGSKIIYGQEIELSTYSMSECDKSQTVFRKPFELLSENYENDTLVLEMSGVTNCSGVSRVFLDVLGDTIEIYTVGGKRILELKKDTTFQHYTIDSLWGKFPDTTGVVMNIKVTSSFSIEETTCDCCYTFSFKIVGTDPKKKYAYKVNRAAVITKN